MYTALLTTEQYGIGELVNNTAELLYPLCCLGVYEGVFRFSIDRDSDNKAVLSTGIGIALSLCRLWQLREFSAIHLLALITHGNWSFSALLLPLK